ncbi:MAG TPA: alpha/beta hydrolase [Tepidisphaeraceae bacterium]|nr:alpha/beta hydrolase [Tepidisphaeraceae bacterium]
MLSKMIGAIVMISFAGHALAADPPASIPLWANGAPGSEARKNIPEVVKPEGPGQSFTSITSVHNPSIIPYLPPKDKSTGVAVIVIPGGGHSQLAIGHEGYYVGEWLAAHGVAGIVVKYRLAREPGSTYTIEKDALADVDRAIRTARARAAEWNINPDKVGVMGFSAGGELAALASMRMDGPTENATDPIDQQSAKPNFQALIYPGQSGKIQPAKDSPPVFLACGNLDRQDISEGLANVYLLFKKVGVSAELHVYAKTGHGFGIKPNATPPASEWPMQFRQWLENQGMIGK